MRHAKNLLAMGHLVFGSDTDANAVKEFIRVGGGHLGQDDRFKGDGVVIASPTTRHVLDMLRTAAWERPFFVEKPIANSKVAASVEEALKYCKMVGYNLRFHSCVKKAREWLPLIGAPHDAHFTCAQFNAKPSYLRDGVILNWSHEIDLALYLLGPAKVIKSETHLTDGKDDSTDIWLRHDSGCISTIHLDYLTTPEDRGFQIAGESGVIVADLVGRRIKKTTNIPGVHWIDVKCGGSFDEDYVEEMQAFIDRLDGKETLGCSAEEGLEILKICLEVRKQGGLT